MPHELQVAASLENVRQITEFVRDVARGLGLTEEAVFDIDVAVEEAAANIVRHAYGPDGRGDMRVRVETTDRELRIAFTDWGQPFEADPAHLAVDVPLETRAQGGMGVLLIHELMDEVTRTTAAVPGGPNVLTMVKHFGR